MHTGENALERFLEKLIEWEGLCIDYLKANIPMRPLSAAQDMRYNTATECCICHRKNRPFDSDQDDWRKVHDHDHVTGYFHRRGS